MRILDLFCGAGGAAMGLHRYFPEAEILGVDIKPQPHYPFNFEQADAMTYPLDGFDFVWASPPCQGYTTMNNRHGRSGGLIAAVRERLESVDAPWAIENVPGALAELRNPIRLCGTSFGLYTWRHRLFETSFFALAPSCHHQPTIPNVAVYGAMDGRRLWTRADGSTLHAWHCLDDARIALDIDWMTESEIRQAIPPAYSEYLAQFIPVNS